jgi:hypothetical protein
VPHREPGVRREVVVEELRDPTPKARSNRATVPVTRAKTPERSTAAVSPRRRIARPNAARVAALAP